MNLIRQRAILPSLLTFFILAGCEATTPGSFPPMKQALRALTSDVSVKVSKVTVEEWKENSNFYYVFEPNDTNPETGFIFYPGGAVDPRSYAPFARAIAEQGFLTVILKMPEDLAIMAFDRATTVINNYETIKTWAIGGHSLGGVSSCAFVQSNSEKVAGVVMWASYPSDFYRIDDKNLELISIYGTNDGLVTLDEIQESEEHFPPDAQFEPVEGGNHTQFGWYDTSPDPLQPGDNPAHITRGEQQDQVVQITSSFLESLDVE